MALLKVMGMIGELAAMMAYVKLMPLRESRSARLISVNQPTEDFFECRKAHPRWIVSQ